MSHGLAIDSGSNDKTHVQRVYLGTLELDFVNTPETVCYEVDE
jgi:hypothetical protein